jgi:hypothetical protein
MIKNNASALTNNHYNCQKSISYDVRFTTQYYTKISDVKTDHNFLSSLLFTLFGSEGNGPHNLQNSHLEQPLLCVSLQVYQALLVETRSGRAC